MSKYLRVLLPGTVEELLHALGSIDFVRQSILDLTLEAVVSKPEHLELVAASRMFSVIHPVGSPYDLKIDPTKEQSKAFGKDYAEQQGVAARKILNNKDFELPVSEFNYGMTAVHSLYNSLWARKYKLGALGDVRLIGPKAPVSRDKVKEWRTYLRKEFKWYGNEPLILMNMESVEEEDELVEAMESYRSKKGTLHFSGVFFSLEQEEMERDPVAYTSLISLASYVIGRDWEVTAAAGLQIPSVRIPTGIYTEHWLSIQAPNNTVFLTPGVPVAAIPRAIEQYLST
jgi:hypothetical protein